MGIPVLLKSPEARKVLFEQCDIDDEDGAAETDSEESSQEAMPPPKQVAPKVERGKCVEGAVMFQIMVHHLVFSW